MRDKINLILIVAFVGLIAGMFGSFVYDLFENSQESKESLIEDFYNVENAAIVSPHSLRKMMAKGDDSFILVDLRSTEEYELAHIAGAINIPAYKDRDTSDYGAVDRIVSEFSELDEDKDIIVYCYSGPCMTGRKVGLILAKHDIYVRHLGIGWNEWRYDWNGWNHEHEWNITRAEDYIVSGSEPGQVVGVNRTSGCPISGGLGC